jgi:hypothetical protein
MPGARYKIDNRTAFSVQGAAFGVDDKTAFRVQGAAFRDAPELGQVGENCLFFWGDSF